MGIYCGQEESFEETTSEESEDSSSDHKSKSSHRDHSKSKPRPKDEKGKSGSHHHKKEKERSKDKHRHHHHHKKEKEKVNEKELTVTTMQTVYVPTTSVAKKNLLLQEKQNANNNRSTRHKERRKTDTGTSRRKSSSDLDFKKDKKSSSSSGNDKRDGDRKGLRRTSSVSVLSSYWEKKDQNDSFNNNHSTKSTKSLPVSVESSSSKHRKLKRTVTTDAISLSSAKDSQSSSSREIGVKKESSNSNPLQGILTQFQRASELSEILEIYESLNVACGVKDRSTSTQTIKKETMLASFWIKQMWTTFDLKSNHEIYKVPYLKKNKENAVVIGAGPAGLSCALELHFLGFNVCVLEKRNYIERNNILHLWPWSMHYLTSLNAKVFYPKFGCGGIDHIGTKQLQRLMVKICLLLGITIKWGHEFQGVQVSKSDSSKWELKCNPSLDSPILFNVLIGADGERSNVVKEFKFSRKSFKGSLSIGITVNFENNHSAEESSLREFGVSKIFEQKLFGDLEKNHNIDLENLVYYRGETHYFVMTAKRESLITNKVFNEVFSDVESLIATKNINYKNLQKYLTTVATSIGISKGNSIVTNPQTQKLDIQIFDFSERLMAEESVKLVDNPKSSKGLLKGKLLVSLVGDSLIQPFWPLGTGCNRAFLSSLDTAWMLRCIYLQSESIDTLIESRNSNYSKMKNILNGAIATPYSNTTIDPLSRYGTSANFQGL